MVPDHSPREVYLEELRSFLKRVPAGETEEILREISTHLAEKSTVGDRIDPMLEQQAILDLGPASDLGRLFLADFNLQAAGVSRSPHRILRSLFQWSTFSAIGFFTLLVGLLGYLSAAVLLVSAVLKPFVPESIGVWYRPHPFSISTGYHAAKPASFEVLGWALVPVFIVAGSLLSVLTTWTTSWAIRRFAKRLRIGKLAPAVSLQTARR